MDPMAVESANFPPFFSKENQLEKLEKNGKTPMSRASILSSPTSAVHPSLESFRCFPATFKQLTLKKIISSWDLW